MADRIGAVERKSFLDVVVTCVSVAVASLFSLSVLVTQAFFTTFNPALLRALSFSDYSTAVIYFLAPVLSIIAVLFCLLIFWGAFVNFLLFFGRNILGKTRRFFVSAYQPIFRFPPFGSTAIFRLGPIFFEGSTTPRSGSLEEGESQRNIITNTKFWLHWIDCLVIIAPLSLLLLFVAFIDGLNILDLGSAMILLLIYFTGLWTISWILDAGFRRRIEVNGRLIRNQKDYDSLSSREVEAFERAAIELTDRSRFWKRLILATFSIWSLMAIAEDYGQSAALQAHRQILDEVTSGRRALGAPTLQGAIDEEESRRHMFGGVEVIRVVEHGIIAFDSNPIRVVFVNDHGLIRASFETRFFIPPDRYRKISELADQDLDSAEDKSAVRRARRQRDQLKTESSLCIQDRVPILGSFVALVRSIQVIAGMKRPPEEEECDNLVNRFQEVLAGTESKLNDAMPTQVPTAPAAPADVDPQGNPPAD